MNYTTSDKDHVGANASRVYNVEEIPSLEEELKTASGTPNFPALLKKYEGPDTGLDYDDATKKFKIASGWYENYNGDIVRKPTT